MRHRVSATLYYDIDEAAKAAKKDDPADPQRKIFDPDFKKNHGLEFEPVKVLSTIIVALGPVLTSGFLVAIKGVS